MSHKSVAVLSAAMLAFIAGCAADWRKEGVSSEGATTALSECKYQAGLAKVPPDQQKDVVANCMQGKGFRWH
jgi:hypothetical protein